MSYVAIHRLQVTQPATVVFSLRSTQPHTHWPLICVKVLSTWKNLIVACVPSWSNSQLSHHRFHRFRMAASCRPSRTDPDRLVYSKEPRTWIYFVHLHKLHIACVTPVSYFLFDQSIQACWWPSRSRLAKLPAKTMPNIYGSSGERLTLELGPFRFQANLTLLLLLSVYDSARTLGQRTRVRMHMLGQFPAREHQTALHRTYVYTCPTT
jgi:hypothetical protein